MIEIEITAPILDRMNVNAALGVPEIWRKSRTEFEVLGLDEAGRYTRRERSLSFPWLPASEIAAGLGDTRVRGSSRSSANGEKSCDDAQRPVAGEAKRYPSATARPHIGHALSPEGERACPTNHGPTFRLPPQCHNSKYGMTHGVMNGQYIRTASIGNTYQTMASFAQTGNPLAER